MSALVVPLNRPPSSSSRPLRCSPPSPPPPPPPSPPGPPAPAANPQHMTANNAPAPAIVCRILPSVFVDDHRALGAHGPLASVPRDLFRSPSFPILPPEQRVQSLDPLAGNGHRALTATAFQLERAVCPPRHQSPP